MELVAPNLNEPGGHGRYYIAKDIGLQVASGDRRAYVQSIAGQTMCSEGAADNWIVQTFNRGTGSCMGREVAGEIRLEVRNLPEWARHTVEIVPAAMVSRRDYVDGNWTYGIDAHWELGPETRISVSD